MGVFLFSIAMKIPETNVTNNIIKFMIYFYFTKLQLRPFLPREVELSILFMN